MSTIILYVPYATPVGLPCHSVGQATAASAPSRQWLFLLFAVATYRIQRLVQDSSDCPAHGFWHQPAIPRLESALLCLWHAFCCLACTFSVVGPYSGGQPSPQPNHECEHARVTSDPTFLLPFACPPSNQSFCHFPLNTLDQQTSDRTPRRFISKGHEKRHATITDPPPQEDKVSKPSPVPTAFLPSHSMYI